MPDLNAQLQAIGRSADQILREDELKQKIERSITSGRPLRIKLGVDPTAPDIHLGHTVVLRKLRAFQDIGHQAVLIIGDYTALIGDPSGRSKTRPQLTAEEIETNATTYLEQVNKILDLDRLEIVRNGDWFREMSFKQVLSLAAQVTVSQMLERDDFQKRYRDQSPIGLHEFLYPLMQGYDSVMVRADVELGGSDQTFNLLVGREFQKAEGMEQQVCITHPLLVGLDGAQKMSKTLSNYVGVDESAKEMFGKLMSLPDNLMTAYFELLTDLPSEETSDLVSENTHPRQAKERLAVEIVTMYHGSEAADGQAEEFRRVFSDKELPSDMPDLEVNEGELEEGQIRVLKLMSLAGFISTNSEGRRLMQQGGVTIDGEQVQDPHAEIVPRDGSILKVGKRKFARLRRDA